MQSVYKDHLSESFSTTCPDYVSPPRNMLQCSSVWTPPLCLRKSYAMPGPFRSSGTVPDLLCKLTARISDSRTHRFLSISSGTQLPFFLPVLTFSTRGGFVALSPISPQNMFLQAFSHSREEKEEEDDDDYRSPYHPYHHPHGHHLHLHHLVKNLDIPG